MEPGFRVIRIQPGNDLDPLQLRLEGLPLHMELSDSRPSVHIALQIDFQHISVIPVVFRIILHQGRSPLGQSNGKGISLADCINIQAKTYSSASKDRREGVHFCPISKVRLACI